MMKRSATNKAGFTLIEILVVLSIMAVLSAMLIAYNHTNTSQLALTVDQSTVVGALNRAKALALEKYVPSGTGTGYATCAYGVNFNAGNETYTIYGITAKDCGAVTDYARGGSQPYVDVQALSLDTGIMFVSPTPADIYFIPPYLEAGSTSGSSSLVTLLDKKTGQMVQISVSSGGAVSMQ